MNLGTIDWIVIVLLLVALLLGLIKGYKHGTTRLGVVGGILLGYYAGVPVARALMNTRLGYEFLTGAFKNTLPSTSSFSVDLAGQNTAFKTESLGKALTELNVPSFFQGMVTTNAIVLDGDVKTALASAFANFVLMGVCFLFFFILAFVLCRIIFGKTDRHGDVFGENGKSLMGRFSGAINSMLGMSIYMIIGMTILVLISQLMVKYGNTAFQDWLNSDLKLGDSSFSIGKIIYNVSGTLLSWINL